MSQTAMKNLHVPLPDLLYRRLRGEAERAHRPATDLAREAIDRWLSERERRTLHEAVRTYARKAAGTRADLDADLEAASIEHLLNPGWDRGAST